MEYQNIFFTMPDITGNTRFYLSENHVYQIGAAIQGVEFSKDAIQFFFDTGIWVIAQDEVTEENEVTEAPTAGFTFHEGTTQTISADTVGAQPTKTGAIASDGGSSTYYDISVPEWLIDRILARAEEGHAYIKTEELIEVAFQSDFDAGNVFKSLVRLWGAFNGAGKAGNSVSYEKKKIEYSVGKLQQRFDRQEFV